MQHSSSVAALIAVAYLVSVLSSRAAAAPRVAVVSAGTCPARDTVISALAQAMPDVVIVADAAAVPGDTEPVVVVSDDSVNYHTVVRGVVRTLVDAPGNCEERARKVAVVAALALEPPLNASRAPDAPDAVAEHVVPALADSGRSVRLEIGTLAEFAWIGRSRLSPRGGTARLTIERDALGLVVGGSLASWSELSGQFVQRIPIDVVLQLRRRERWIAGAVDLGPSLVFQRTKIGGERSVHLEADVRLSGRLEVWIARAAGVYAAVTGTYVPSPAPGLGRGLDYSMPTWWLAASAGLVLQIR